MSKGNNWASTVWFLWMLWTRASSPSLSHSSRRFRQPPQWRCDFWCCHSNGRMRRFITLTCVSRLRFPLFVNGILYPTSFRVILLCLCHATARSQSCTSECVLSIMTTKTRRFWLFLRPFSLFSSFVSSLFHLLSYNQSLELKYLRQFYSSGCHKDCSCFKALWFI
jgi:hypothetical protein